MVGTYEIFDLEGMTTRMLGMPTINFTKDVLLAFTTHYPQSMVKAVIINAPDFLPFFWRLIAVVLPASVKAKVDIRGRDYKDVTA